MYELMHWEAVLVKLYDTWMYFAQKPKYEIFKHTASLFDAYWFKANYSKVLWFIKQVWFGIPLLFPFFVFLLLFFF